MLALACAVLAMGHSANATTEPTTRPISLLISMENGQSITLDESRFQKLARKTITAVNHDGIKVTYSGVALADLLALVAIPSGDRLRGDAMAMYIVAQGSDGYQVTLSIAEADNAFREQGIIVADSQNGGPLPTNAQPLQLIIPRDKRTSRWVRSLTKLDVRRAQ
ncbi:MAG: molybdopterin-dependent oxidoreductase [Phycisphaerales bacterium]|jgi:hypothetical protein|nr:molybdopterin-dependent oxidoreductase [Phycisphaerales bacterium]